MKINSAQLNHLISNSLMHVDDKKYLVALALARAVGYGLSLPTGGVESPTKYFQDTHKEAVEQFLVTVNEMSVINIQETYELTFKIWKMRYSFVFDCMSLGVMKFLDCEIDCGNKEIPQIYTDLIVKLGPETMGTFVKDVMNAVSYSEGV